MDSAIILFVFFTAVSNLFLGFLVYWKNPKSATHKLLALITLTFVAWTIANYFSLNSLQSETATLFWIRAVMSVTAPLGPLVYLFLKVFPSNRLQISSTKLIALIIYTALVSALSFSDYVFSSVTIKDGITPTPAFGISLYAVLLLGSLLAGFLSIIKKYRNSRGQTRLQIKYVILGSIFAFGMSTVTNFVFVVLLKISNLVILGPSFSLILVAFLTYAIVKHRLLDIRFLAVRTVVYFLLVASLAILYALVVFAIGITFFKETPSILQVCLYAALSVIVAFSFSPLKNVIEKFTEKLFYRRYYRPEDILYELSHALNSTVGFEEVLENIFNIFKKTLHIDRAVFVVKLHEKSDKIENIFDNKEFVTHPFGLQIDNQNISKIISSLTKKLETVTSFDDIKAESSNLSAEHNLIEWMSKNDLDMVLPLRIKNETIGVIILGQKQSGDPFTVQDINVLETFSLQAAIGIENILLFMHSKDFNERLKAEVERATTELKQKNKNLEILRKMDAIIATTLDLKDMCQKIVDTVSWEFGYDGALISLVDEERNVLVPTAVSQTPLIKRAMTLLPKKMEELVTQMDDQKNMGIQAIKLKGKVYTTSLAEALAPVVPKIVAEGMQKIIGTKGIIFYPIFAKDRVLGVICLAMHVNPHDISAAEFNILDAFMEEVGIALENAYLYQETMKANKVLYQTNLKLVGLDKMKDEFVSVASHELRTPMTAIKGYIWMVLQGKGGPISEKQKYYLERIGQSTQRLINLVNDMLSVSRIEGGRIEINLKDFDVVDMAQSVQEELQIKADEKKLKLLFDRPTEEIHAYADPDKTREILVNLVGNALKFTETGSITIVIKLNNGRVYLSVVDTGRGIAQEDLPRLFQKFGRLNNQFATVAETTGTGLGLYICKKYAELMNGNFEVKSEVGKGSQFTLSIPSSA